MRVGLLRNLAQLVDHMRWRRLVRVAHTQIDNVFTRLTRRVPHRVHFCDNVRWQTLHAVKIGIHLGPSLNASPVVSTL